MSVLDGPGEGTWSMFAMKVVEERDELRYKLAGEAAHIKSLEGLLVDAARERDEAREVREDLRKELAQWKVVATEVVGMFDPVIKSGTEVDWPHLKSVCVGVKEANKSLREVKDRARRAGQILIEEIGADGPTNVDAVAEHATVLIRGLRDQVSDLQAAIADCWRARVALALQGAEVQAERDKARDELAKTSADFHDVWESRDKVIEERERARQACNAYWHDLTRIALLCAQTDDEYPLKAVERTVRERDEALAQVARREREHEALLETAQKALAHVEAERDLLKNHYSPEAAAKLRAELASARAEIEMLRGVGND